MIDGQRVALALLVALACVGGIVVRHLIFGRTLFSDDRIEFIPVLVAFVVIFLVVLIYFPWG